MMKQYFLMLGAALLSIALVSCKKDDKNDTLKEDENGGNSIYPSLNGTNYYPIVLDETTAKEIESRIVCDLRPNDGTNNLWVWDNTYAGSESAGLSFYGLTEGWVSLKVGTVGWSGAGWNVTKEAPNFSKLADIAQSPKSYYLHIGYKGAAGVAHELQLVYSTQEKKFTVGDGEYDGRAALAPISNDGKFVANEWNEYEISIADLGIDYTVDLVDSEGKPAAGTNVFVCLSGGETGVEINLDAVFIYKK